MSVGAPLEDKVPPTEGSSVQVLVAMIENTIYYAINAI